MREDLRRAPQRSPRRPLAGDTDWADERARRRARPTPQALARAARASWPSATRPASPYALEPDLKEDAGGRRDYDELVWTAAIVSGRRARDSPPGWSTRGSLAAEVRTRLAMPRPCVSAARWELQRAGFGQRMTLDAARALADRRRRRPSSARLPRPRSCSRTRARRVGGPERACLPRPLRRVSSSRCSSRGRLALTELEEAAQAGRLEHAVARLPRPDDAPPTGPRPPAHGGRALARAPPLSLAEPPERHGPGSLALAIGDLRVVQVAALVHDARQAECRCRTMPSAAPSPHAAFAAAPRAHRQPRRRCGDSVRLHLVLVETATRIDLDDEDAVLAARRAIGTPRLLAPLHLLTAADSRATGPATWSAWTAALVGTLVVAARRRALGRSRRRRHRARGRGGPRRGARAMPRPAIAPSARSSRTLRCAILRPRARARSCATPGSSPSSATASAAGGTHRGVSPGPADETRAVTVAAADRPELLARIAGAMALAGPRHPRARRVRRRAAIALDTFVVTSATRRPVGTETFTKLERLLRAALHDRLELPDAPRRAPPPLPRREKPGPVAVEIVSAGWDTALRVARPTGPACCTTSLARSPRRASTSAGRRSTRWTGWPATRSTWWDPTADRSTTPASSATSPCACARFAEARYDAVESTLTLARGAS